MSKQKVFTTREIALMYDVTTQAVSNWVKDGAPHKVTQMSGERKAYSFDLKELQEWLDKQYRRVPVRKL